MCPDKEVLSAFFDGELDSQWEKKIHAHLESCAACREKLQEYTFLQNRLKDNILEVGSDNQIRVWENIEASRVSMPPVGFWKGKVVMPTPVAAAAMVIFVMLVVFSIAFNIGYVERALAREPAITPEPMAIRVETVEDLLRFIESQNSYVEVNLQIPEGSNFYIFGEPQFLRAADYNASR